MKRRERARCHDQTAIRSVRERGNRSLELANVDYVERVDIHLERRCHRLNDAELGGWDACD